MKHQNIDVYSYEQALKFTPGGGQTRSRTPGHVGPADCLHSTFPMYAHSARGAYVYPWLSDEGLLDMFGANAAVPIGHAHESVVKAVSYAAASGSLPSLSWSGEAIVSRDFIQMCAPWAEQVRWVKTGTEALMAAVRIARAHTGRNLIVVMDSSYHGWSDLNDARFTLQGQKNGVPSRVADLTVVLPYGKPIDMDLSTTAAVIIEPHRWIKTDVEWLKGVVKAAHAQGALVIMDEMVYGMRWAIGGATEYYGVISDLACFGKALGGGIPVALVCGKANVMAQAAKYVSGTYFGDTLGMSAAQAVMSLYQRQPIIKMLWERGRVTWHGFDDAVHDAGLTKNDIRLDGFPVHWRVVMGDGSPVPPPIMDRAQEYAIAEKVLFHKASNNASAAMTVDEAYRGGYEVGRAMCRALVAEQ